MIFVSLLIGHLTAVLSHPLAPACPSPLTMAFFFFLPFSSPQTCVCGCGSDMKASAILFPELVHDLLIGDAVLLDDDGEKSKCD